MSVRRAQREVDAREFAEWLAIENVAPSDEADWVRAAMIACVIANANRGRNQRAFRIEDFMPRRRRKKPMTGRQMLNVFKQFAAAHNAAQDAKHGRS
jgi:hypothetical protein